MQPIPRDVLIRFNDAMKRRNVSISSQADYPKWLLYFLGFRAQYSSGDPPCNQVKLFAEKLRSKNQTAAQVEQATDAISLYFSLQQGNGRVSPAGVAEHRRPEKELKSPLDF